MTELSSQERINSVIKSIFFIPNSVLLPIFTNIFPFYLFNLPRGINLECYSVIKIILPELFARTRITYRFCCMPFRFYLQPSLKTFQSISTAVGYFSIMFLFISISISENEILYISSKKGNPFFHKS